MRRLLIGVTGVVLAALLAASVWAATIVGTARNDTLLGTAKADVLDGKAGNDKLYGRGGNDVLKGGSGNDLLVGGPGADRYSCGAGKDAVVGGPSDKATADCESVTIPAAAPPPTLSIDDNSIDEGNSGTSSLSLTVSLSVASTKTVQVGFATADGTATAGSDYTATSGTLTFKPGETSASIDVPVIGDTVIEGDETVTVTLSSPANATIARGSVAATIRNDDVARALAGKYCGFNDQGKSVCLDVVSDGRAVANFRTESIVGCTNSAQAIWTLSFSGPAELDSSLNFTYSYSGPLKSSSGTATNIIADYSISGRFDTAGNVSGSLSLKHITWDANGTHYDCSAATFAWSAKRQ